MQYDFNLGANGAQFLDVAGKFFKYKSGTGLLRVRNSKGGYVDLLPGQGVSGLEFSSLNITDMTGAANKGVLLAGAYEFRDDRISGTVDVVDGGKSRTLSGVTFVSFTSQTALAGNFQSAQLWNPVGSGKNLVLESMTAASAVVTGYMHQVNSVPLTTLGGVFPKKLNSGFTGVGQVRAQASAAWLGINMMINSAATIFKPTEPIIIPPGSGYIITTTGQNVDITANFEWYEDPI